MTEPRIVGFAKDWDDVPTCVTHVLREMGRTLPVLWVSSIGTRKPRMVSRRDLARVWRRMPGAPQPRGAFPGAFGRTAPVENRLRTLWPALVPGARTAFGRRLNRFLFDLQTRRVLADMGSGPIEYWCFVPNAVDLLPPEGGSKFQISNLKSQITKVVYYCVDDWGKFEGLDGRWLERKERELIERADFVFCASRRLERKCRQAIDRSAVCNTQSPSLRYAPHGVSYAKFRAALEPGTPVPAELAALPRPVLGFYGNIRAWLDFELIGRLARARPGWTFVMIGPVSLDIGRLALPGNVHFTGRREHDLLPGCCKGFDAAIIPYDMKNARMESVNPVKALELLAAGVPIAACDLPELRERGKDALICRSDAEWLNALETQIARRDREEISRRVAGEDWSVKVRALRAIVDAT